jgi:hypothetical protein
MIGLVEMLRVLAMLRLTAIDKVDRSLLFAPWTGYLQSDKEDESCGTVDKGISRHTTEVRYFSKVEIETRKW